MFSPRYVFTRFSNLLEIPCLPKKSLHTSVLLHWAADPIPLFLCWFASFSPSRLHQIPSSSQPLQFSVSTYADILFPSNIPGEGPFLSHPLFAFLSLPTAAWLPSQMHSLSPPWEQQQLFCFPPQPAALGLFPIPELRS